MTTDDRERLAQIRKEIESGWMSGRSASWLLDRLDALTDTLVDVVSRSCTTADGDLCLWSDTWKQAFVQLEAMGKIEPYRYSYRWVREPDAAVPREGA